MEQIKLSTIDTKYESDNKTYVKCIIKVETKNICYPTYRFIGIAKLHNGDKFDFNVGSKIALAKAERKAYKTVGKIIKRDSKYYISLSNSMSEFVAKAANMVKHNDEYIKKLVDK